MQAPYRSDPPAATPGLRTLGRGSQQAARGNDGRFTDQGAPSVVRPNAAYTWCEWPTAIYSEVYRKTFYGWTDNRGFAWAGSHDHGTGQRLETQLTQVSEVDDHDSAVMIVLDPDGPNPGKILAAFAYHVGSAATYVSTAAGSIASFAAGVQTESADASYASLVQVGDTARTAYLFYRYGNSGTARPHVFKTSTDGGASWSARTTLISSPGNNRPYVQIRRTAANRVDVIFTNGHPNEITNSVYHFYFTVAANGTRTFYKSDGTLIGGDAALPITSSSATRIYDGSSTNAWTWDLGLVEGVLTALYVTFPGSSATHNYRRATLSGGVWTNETITDGGSHSTDYLYAAEAYYSGGICLDPNDADAVYLSKCYAAGDFRLEKWTKSAGVWAQAAALSGPTSSVNARPRYVEGSPTTRIVYWRGRYTTYTDFATDLHAEPPFGPPSGPPQAIFGLRTTPPVAGLRTLGYDPDSPGVETMRRKEIASTTISILSGTLRLAFFTADRDELITKLIAMSGGTPAAATPTLVRYGLYSVASNGDLTLVAASANTTSTFSAADTEYPLPLSSGGGLPTSYVCQAGFRYALGTIVVSGTTTPTLRGQGAGVAANMARDPRQCAFLTGQTDLPTTISAGSLVNSASVIYMAGVAA